MSPEIFAARAEALVGAPFRLGGRDPVTGLDCVGLVASARGEGVATPGGYRLRNSSIATYLDFAARAGFHAATGPMTRGDLILARPGPAQHHALVVVGCDHFIHAHAGLRRVVAHLGPLPWPVEAHWRLQNDKD